MTACARIDAPIVFIWNPPASIKVEVDQWTKPLLLIIHVVVLCLLLADGMW